MVASSSVNNQPQSDNQVLEDVRHRLNEALQSLSPEKLGVVADFAAYLADTESETATQELIAIPGLLEKINECKKTPVEQYVDWRSLRSDV
ncbi:MAG: hypothetical protein AAFR58_15075 [Cyanobacteria bacterium J06627_28]